MACCQLVAQLVGRAESLVVAYQKFGHNLKDNQREERGGIEKGCFPLSL